jgi:hypothetical protein
MYLSIEIENESYRYLSGILGGFGAVRRPMPLLRHFIPRLSL